MVAGILGHVVSSSMGILLVPGHVRISGIEACGHIVFCTLIRMFLAVLERGTLSGAPAS